MDRPRKSTSPARLAVFTVAALLMTLTGCETPPNSLLRQQAQNALWDGKIDLAERKLTMAVEQDAADWKAAMMLGEVRLRQQRPLDAQLLFERAATNQYAEESLDRIYDGLAEALYQQDLIENLQVMLTTTTRQRGGTADYLRQARYLARIGDPDGARLALRKAARFAEADDASPYLAAADYYESIDDQANAAIALRRAYAIKPDDPRIQQRLRGLGVVPGPTVALPPEHVSEAPAE